MFREIIYKFSFEKKMRFPLSNQTLHQSPIYLVRIAKARASPNSVYMLLMHTSIHEGSVYIEAFKIHTKTQLGLRLIVLRSYQAKGSIKTIQTVLIEMKEDLDESRVYCQSPPFDQGQTATINRPTIYQV